MIAVQWSHALRWLGRTLRAYHRPLKTTAAVVLLAALYASADWRAVGRAVLQLDAVLLLAALTLFIPQALVSAARWRRLAEPYCPLSLRDATRHTLAASALNLVVPSKLGDLGKAAMCPVRSTRDRQRLAGRVVWEKAADLAALGVLLLAGTLGVRAGAHTILIAALLLLAARLRRGNPEGRLAAASSLAASSMLLWSLHLLQIQCFLHAAGVVAPWELATARVPLAIFAGLLPLTLWGVGTRDSALIWLFADVASAPAMAVVGLLTALRYVIPGAVGICVVGNVWQRPRSEGPGELETSRRAA